MKKSLLIILTFILGINLIFSQVGINTNTPKGALQVNGQRMINDTTNVYYGLVVPVVDSTDVVINPQGSNIAAGTLVFTEKDACIRIMGPDKWEDCIATNLTVGNFFNYDVWGGANLKAKKLSAGQDFTLAIDYNTGALFSSGAGDSNRTGRGNTNNATFGLVLSKKMVDASAGYLHGLAADSEGKLWSWGSGANGRTGMGNTTTYALPTQNKTIPTNVKIIRVEAGYQSSLVLDNNGSVYYAGTSAQWLNGLGTTTASTSFTKMSFFTSNNINVKDISFGYYSAAVINDLGEVYTWGSREFGRLGIGGGTTNTSATPTKITLPKTIKKVAMGNRFGLAVSADGKTLYGWGDPVGWGISAGTSFHTTPIDVTSYIPLNESTDADHDGVLDADFEIYSVAADVDVLNTGIAYSAAILTTNKGIFAVGGNNYANKLGLGLYKGTATSIYSPNTTAAQLTSGFQPLYKASTYPNISFKEASLGSQHAVFLQTEETSGNGSFGYGSGECNIFQLGSNQLGFATTTIPVLLKR